MDSDSPDLLLNLLRRWRAGESDALGLLLQHVEQWLHSEISREMTARTVNAQDSWDLTHQAIVNFLESGPRFIPRSEAQLRGLLRRIAINELIDQNRKGKYRDGKRGDTLFGASDSMSGLEVAARSSERPSRVATASEEWNWLRLALQFVEPEDRHLLVAREVDGVSWESIAKEFGLPSPEAARVRVARLKPRLANIVKKLRAGRIPDPTRSDGGD